MTLTVIGRVKSPGGSQINHSSRPEEESRLVLYDEFAQGLDRLAGAKYIQVILGRPGPEECGHREAPWDDSPLWRLSGLDVATVEVLTIGNNCLSVKGLAAENNSPIYYLKPVVASLNVADSMAEVVERLKANPRADFMKAIRADDRQLCLVKTAEIHGHFCPGSALGVLASIWGLEQLGLKSVSSDGLENLMAIVETNACFADGVQAVSGCTLGNNALVYRDLGRHAVTLALRGRNAGVRIRVRPDFQSIINRQVPDFYPLLDKVIKKREASEKEEAAFKAKAQEAAWALIETPFEDLLLKQTVRPVLPDYAPITESAICPICQEQVMVTKTVTGNEGRALCLACAGLAPRQVDGRGIVVQ